METIGLRDPPLYSWLVCIQVQIAQGVFGFGKVINIFFLNKASIWVRVVGRILLPWVFLDLISLFVDGLLL